MPDAATTPPATLDQRTAAQVKARRERLRSTEEHLASAAAAPFPGRLDLWWAGVANAATELASMFEHHVHDTEGTEGLFSEIEAAAPRLANDVSKLRSDHREIERALERLTASTPPRTPDEVSAAREAILQVLSRLARHRFAGSDLLYQAYQVDIGAMD
ncbi:MAG: hemerythrin domain-containing protein [Acidimicrobiales bacterium]|nr:hemerythrin domain-containing protein [Acidimicrobiales bacterium]